MRHFAPASAQFTLLLGIIAGLPALSIDISAPTLALLPAALGTTIFVAGLSLSLFVLGFGVGQFAGGRTSDQIGRRRTLLVALSIYIAAGLCCSFATSGGYLATARMIQGFGAGGCSVQAYAIVQDLFVAEEARRKQAYVSTVLTLLPMLAPALGTGMIALFGWRSVHGALVVAGLVLLAIVGTMVAESKPAHQRKAVTGLGLADSADILRDPAFSRIVAVNALSYASLFAYIAGAPVVVIAQWGYGSLVYAAVFACTAAALSGGAMTSARLARRFDSRRLAWPALLCQAAASAGLLGLALGMPTVPTAALLPLLLVSCFSRGIASPNLVHAAISGHRERAGLAAALVGLAQLVAAAVSSAVLAQELDRFGAVGVAAIMAVLTAAAVVLWMVTDAGRTVAEQG